MDLNKASKAKLQTLPRIGAVSAEHIIAARPYTSVDELQNVSGITRSIYSALKHKVTV